MGFQKTAYTERSRKAISLVNKLRDAGAQFQLDLPCVVVCGNQSAGKSSLLERLCGVKLPRAAGTCTKCPTEVRLSTSPPDTPGVTWRCHIKLRKEYDKHNKQLQSKPTEQSFKTLDHNQKDVLHHYISAAQRALLNPDAPADTFVNVKDILISRDQNKPDSTCSSKSNGCVTATPLVAEDPPAKDALAFTRNVIVLEIQGADVDLALIDLPGIIQTEKDDDGSNIELVQQLVKQYISRERTIIVATITCKDDIDNQQIIRLAREADRDGSRTIGVLTKADTIEAQTHDRWLPVLTGTAYQLNLGYYVVVNPSQEDLNNDITQEAAAAKERKFFETDSWFSSREVAGVRKRFGVDALRVQLSERLVELTQKELPRMKEAIDNTLLQVEPAIAKLPAAPSSDATQELLTRMLALSSAVESAVKGTGDMSFHRKIEALFADFKSLVFAARFTVQMGNASKQQKTSSSTAAAVSKHQPANQQQEEDVDFWLDGPAGEDQDHTQQQEPDSSSSTSLITLDKVRSLAREYRGRELPGYTPYKVLEVLVDQHKDRWGEAAKECLGQVAEQLTDMSLQLVQQQFGQFAAAEEHVRGIVSQLQSRLVQDTHQRITDLMKMEQTQTWTQNTHYFTDAKQRFTEQLFTRWYGSDIDRSSKPVQVTQPPLSQPSLGAFGAPSPAFQFGAAAAAEQQQPSPNLAQPAEGSEAQALSALRAAGYDVTAADLAFLKSKKRQRQQEDLEAFQGDEGLIDIIAGVLAYFKVSSKRVVDNVPMHIRHFLLGSFRESMREQACRLPMDLATGRATSSAVGCLDGTSSSDHGKHLTAEDLMSEDRSIADRREQLMRQQRQLKDVRKILNGF